MDEREYDITIHIPKSMCEYDDDEILSVFKELLSTVFADDYMTNMGLPRPHKLKFSIRKKP